MKLRCGTFSTSARSGTPRSSRDCCASFSMSPVSRTLRHDLMLTDRVRHHGSSHQLQEFLRAVRARVTMTSVGVGNSFGHPSPVTIGELVRAGARSYRTDRDGDIALIDRSGVLLSRARHGPGTVTSPPPAAGLERIPGTTLTARITSLSRLAANWCNPTAQNARDPPEGESR